MNAGQEAVRLAREAESVLGALMGRRAAGVPAELCRRVVALDVAIQKTLREMLWSSMKDPSAQHSKQLVMIYDIEGTTTPLPFVTKVLYPYSERAMEQFVQTYVTDDAVDRAFGSTASPDPCVALLRSIVAAHPLPSGSTPSPASVRMFVVKVLLDEINANSKAVHLKQVQGMIWRAGYETGQLKGRVFPDAAETIRSLSKSGRVSQHIYSSGSIAAQQLLFKHSTEGDLTQHLDGYHDPQAVGPKVEPASYQRLQDRIQGTLQGPSPVFVFVTDSVTEIKAAQQAGMVCILCARPMNQALVDVEGLRDFGVVTSFSQLNSALCWVLETASRCVAEHVAIVEQTQPYSADQRLFQLSHF